MRFLTFNLWHGLSPTNLVAFEALEPTARRKLREDLQLKILADLSADVAFFQEVNPAGSRLQTLREKLSVDAVAQPDLVGLKLLGLGFPFNLNSGLVTSSSRKFGLKKVKGVSLSRPEGVRLVWPWGSWQLKEERYALYCETLLPQLGRTLLVNTHLHHGLESTPAMLAALDKLAEELELSAGIMSEVKQRLFAGNERRNQELAVLLDAVQSIQSRYETILIAGDLNASPDGNVAKRLREEGFHDAWAEVHGDRDPGYTFDHELNHANHLLQARFPLTLVLEDLSFSTKVKEALLVLARSQETRRRRIDYIWYHSHSGQLKAKKAELIGLPGDDGLAPSDHFGVCVEF